MATKKKAAPKKVAPVKRVYKQRKSATKPDVASLTFYSHGQKKNLELPLDVEDLRQILRTHDSQVEQRENKTAYVGTIAMDGTPTDPDKKMGITFANLVGIAGEINNIIQTVNGITVLTNKLSGNESKPVEFVEPLGDNNLIGNLHHIGSRLSGLGNHLYELQDNLRANI